MEESKEPEKPETKAAEEEEPSRTEEDREVLRSYFCTKDLRIDLRCSYF